MVVNFGLFFRHLAKLLKSTYWLHHVCLSMHQLSVNVEELGSCWMEFQKNFDISGFFENL